MTFRCKFGSKILRSAPLLDVTFLCSKFHVLISKGVKVKAQTKFGRRRRSTKTCLLLKGKTYLLLTTLFLKVISVIFYMFTIFRVTMILEIDGRCKHLTIEDARKHRQDYTSTIDTDSNIHVPLQKTHTHSSPLCILGINDHTCC